MHRTIRLSPLLLGPIAATLLAVAAGCRVEAGSDDVGPPSEDAELTARLGQLNEELLARLGRGDAGGAASLYTQDAILLPPDGRVIRGRDAIRSFWAETVASTRILRAVSDATDVRSDGALASHVGSYTLVTGGAAGESVESRGTTLLVWQRTAEGWRIYADMWTVEPAGA